MRHIGTGRTQYRVVPQCVLAKVNEVKIWGRCKCAFTDKGMFQIGAEAHDLARNLEIGKEYYFQIAFLQKSNIIIDVLEK